jgi:hypothetical protein
MATNKVDLKSDEVRELLGTSPAWLIRWGSALLFLVLLALVVLAFFIKYPANIQFPVSVVNIQKSQAVKSVKDGPIKFWLVDAADVVDTGQPIALQANQADYNHVLALQERLDRFDVKDPSTFKDFGDLDGLNLGSLDELLAGFRKSLVPELVATGGDSKTIRFKKKQERALKKLVQELEKEMEDKENSANVWERSFMEARAAYSSGDISVEELQRIQGISEKERAAFNQLETELETRKRDLKNVSDELEKIPPSGSKEVVDTAAIRQTLSQLEEGINNWLASHLINAPVDGILRYEVDTATFYREGDSLGRIALQVDESIVLIGTTALPKDFSEGNLSFFLIDEDDTALPVAITKIDIESLPGEFSRISFYLEPVSAQLRDFIRQHEEIGLEGRLQYGEVSFLGRIWRDFGS